MAQKKIKSTVLSISRLVPAVMVINARASTTNPPNRTFSNLRVTIMIPHMYEPTPIELAMAEGQQVPEDQAQSAIRHFEDFYEEVFLGKCFIQKWLTSEKWMISLSAITLVNISWAMSTANSLKKNMPPMLKIRSTADTTPGNSFFPKFLP